MFKIANKSRLEIYVFRCEALRDNHCILAHVRGHKLIHDCVALMDPRFNLTGIHICTRIRNNTDSMLDLAEFLANRAKGTERVYS